jgi:hypothetical protein
MLKKLFSVFILCLASIVAGAQELNCKVTVLHDKITGVDNAVFTAMQRSISDFMNTHKWTTDDFAVNEKIDVTILINLTGRSSSEADAYTATLSIIASRPVFNSSYASPIVNYVDKDILFKFSQFVPIQFDDNNVSGTDPLASNLTALLGYYSYLIIGLNYDSFALNGGSTYLKKAQSVVSNAPEQGKNITGWKSVDGTHNRYWIIDQLLNTRFQDIRNYWYIMHREGLDNMYNKPADARIKVLAGLYKMYNVNKENPSSVLVQFFFNAKSDELARVLAQLPNPGDKVPYITMLSQLDVPNAAKYAALK